MLGILFLVHMSFMNGWNPAFWQSKFYDFANWPRHTPAYILGSVLMFFVMILVSIKNDDPSPIGIFARKHFSQVGASLFTAGALAGFIINDYLTRGEEWQASETVKGAITLMSSAFLLLSVSMAIVSTFRKKNILPWGLEYLIYGFIVAFDVTRIITGFMSGEIPSPL